MEILNVSGIISIAMKFFLWRVLFLFQMGLITAYSLSAQQVPIQSYSVDANGQVELQVNSTSENYYVLQVRHKVLMDFELSTSITLGKADRTIITEPAGAYPLEHYQVLEYSIESPGDIDSDGVDDMVEYNNIPIESPLNAALPIPVEDGFIALDSFKTYESLSVVDDFVQWSEFLNGRVYVKYMITDFFGESPKIYFINSELHDRHADFANELGIDFLGDQVKKGQVIYHPSTLSNNGSLGAFVFNYSNGKGDNFDVVQRTHELLAANMPFLKNNLAYFITELSEDEYDRDQDLYDESRIPVLFESDVYADIDYWGLNRAEGFGFFHQMELDEIPGSKDIVLYDALPNSIPRVGGIMTSIMQTPLSHVNLRAIQDNIPNAFIRNPLLVDSIADLLDRYIYYRVEQEEFFIREATLEEVTDWYDDIRPEEEQIPVLNLNYTSILLLDSISFGMSDGYGAKCANVAVMRSFGFPEGTIPHGFGVPFYFYQEFMNHNNFFEIVEEMISDSDFQSNREVREDRLKDFRKEVKSASLPDWMLDELDEMHRSFPDGISIRCRSSTNNEDLPGFSGAGLYTSKTQHPDEGHISKSIKQVYASLWNLRAFEEREFYRVDHFIAAMGVLCHPNYSDEKANGVGVSLDPIYNTSNTFYLNSQVGEDLITNPAAASRAEEILLERVPESEDGFLLVQRSNLVASDSVIMKEIYLDQLRDYLSVIHDEFQLLYNAKNRDDFAMDIEYKITSDDRLIIKQARPWVTYAPDSDTPDGGLESHDLDISPNPAEDFVLVQCDNCSVKSLFLTNITGVILEEILLVEGSNICIEIKTAVLVPGIYVLTGVAKDGGSYYSEKFIKK